jgi:hypothetical protein
MKYLYFADVYKLRYIKFPDGLGGLITVGTDGQSSIILTWNSAGHIFSVLL